LVINAAIFQMSSGLVALNHIGLLDPEPIAEKHPKLIGFGDFDLRILHFVSGTTIRELHDDFSLKMGASLRKRNEAVFASQP
jgi:hypothetical protein